MKSDPSATGSSRRASAAPAPPLLPPADLVASYALPVAPNTSLKVCEPRPNSGVFVLPITMQPAPFMRAAISPSSCATKCCISGEPSVVGKPAALDKSLMACGMPCIHPREAPRASSASHASASASKASSGRSDTSALYVGFTRWMRAR